MSEVRWQANETIFVRRSASVQELLSRGVLKGENALLYVCTLQELDQYFYNWEDGSKLYSRFKGENEPAQK